MLTREAATRAGAVLATIPLMEKEIKKHNKKIIELGDQIRMVKEELEKGNNSADVIELRELVLKEYDEVKRKKKGCEAAIRVLQREAKGSTRIVKRKIHIPQEAIEATKKGRNLAKYLY